MTGLHYFGARYCSAAQGRFTSVDPIGVSKEKLVDPQQWNMYAYGRNNPLRFVDPTGRRVELVGDDEQRRKELEALKQGVGDQAARYLTVKRYSGFLGLGKTHYYVQTTDSKAFAGTNAVAAKLGGIINDTMRDAQIQFVSPGTRIGGVAIGSADARMTPMATATTLTSATVFITSGALGTLRGTRADFRRRGRERLLMPVMPCVLRTNRDTCWGCHSGSGITFPLTCRSPSRID